MNWSANLDMLNPRMPGEFPIGLALFNEKGEVHECNSAFNGFFDPERTDEHFRRKTPVENYLATLLNVDAERGEYDDEKDRMKTGRLDLFWLWDEWATDSGLPIKVRHLRENEEKAVQNDRFLNERYFRYWFREMSNTRSGVEKTYIGCFVDITQSERSRFDLKKDELDFVKRLSKNLVAEEIRDKSLFSLKTRPKAGDGRAGGDMFIFWPLHRQQEERPLVAAFIGDADKHGLRAASSVQQAATIINAYTRNSHILLDPKKNPALEILNNLRSGLDAVSLLDVGGMDGIMLVFDFSEQDKTVMHYAEGKLGALVFSQGDDGTFKVTHEVGTVFGNDNHEENHPPVYRPEVGLNGFNADQVTLGENDMVIAMTDGVRGILGESPGSGDQLDLIAAMVESARFSSHIEPEKDAEPGDDETTDLEQRQMAHLLEGVVDRLAPAFAEPAKDDRLAVAISVRRLRNVVENWNWSDRND